MGNSKKSVFKSALDFEARQLAIALQIIATQKALAEIVKTALPAEIAGHVQHCVLSGKRLLIYTEAASWASQIRFFHMDILNKIIAAGQNNISSVQMRIALQLNQPHEQRSARLPSIENITLLRNQFKEQENGDELKLALSKLAKTLDKRIKAKD